MTDTLATLAGPTAVGAGNTTLFTVPASQVWTVKTILIINLNAATRTVRLGVNGTADADLITAPVALAQNEQAVGDFVLSFAAADDLRVNSDGAGVTVTISGLKQS